ncbi:dienelactone hydrolase family [Fusarium pseudoanthophilum]|uniref:Dienelactone hydrolase family n=1 Tax=Fusarium pseudoanthophilum TaxID=48495 RepID=A0A8H5KVY0_9HYPO|nr:dienelactone hydrolase family [Fusarium pseudoanthophilum]
MASCMRVLMSLETLVPCADHIRHSPFFYYNSLAASWSRNRSFFEAVRLREGPQRRIGAAGFCWGGKPVLTLAHPESRIKDGMPLVDAVFTGHPSDMSLPGDVEPIIRPVSVAIGDRDIVAPMSQINVMKETWKDLDTPTEVVVYPGAGHGFCVRVDEKNENLFQQSKEAEKQALDWFATHFGQVKGLLCDTADKVELDSLGSTRTWYEPVTDADAAGSRHVHGATGMVLSAPLKEQCGALGDCRQEVFRETHSALKATIQCLYLMLRNGDTWDFDEPERDDSGELIVHDIVHKLGFTLPSPEVESPTSPAVLESEASPEESASQHRKKIEDQIPKKKAVSPDTGLFTPCQDEQLPLEQVAETYTDSSKVFIDQSAGSNTLSILAQQWVDGFYTDLSAPIWGAEIMALH